MKEWEKPELNELDVESTEYGPDITSNVDAHWTDGKNSLWSFS